MICSLQSIQSDLLKPRIPSCHLPASNTLRTAHCKRNEMQTIHRGHVQYGSCLILHSYPSLRNPALCSVLVSFLFLKYTMLFSALRSLPGPPSSQIHRHLLTHISTQNNFRSTGCLLWPTYLNYTRPRPLPCLMNKWIDFGGPRGS